MISFTRKPAAALAGCAILALAGAAPSWAADLPGKGVKVIPATSSIAEELFQTKIVMMGLAQLGYDVKDHLEIEYPTMHLAISQGDLTFSTTHWAPLHKAFYEKAGGEKTLWRSDKFVANSLQGYLIDKKTADAHNIKTLDQLADPKIAKLFDADGDGRADLTGCNPGWGCERVIEHHLKEYKLKPTIEHNQGSYFALMADTKTRFEKGESVLYYTWTPLWVSGVLVPGKDVEWLEVPYTSLPDGQKPKTELADGRNLGFAVNTQRIVANKKWVDENPAAKRFFELVNVDVNDVSAQNLKMRDGEDKAKDVTGHVEAWIKANQKAWDGWIAEAMKAGA